MSNFIVFSYLRFRLFLPLKSNTAPTIQWCGAVNIDALITHKNKDRRGGLYFLYNYYLYSVRKIRFPSPTLVTTIDYLRV